MYPNPYNNGGMNGAPFQYSYNPQAYSYFNPYQNQPTVQNVVEQQYYNHPHQIHQQIQPQMQPQIQPMYFPYVQQGMYPSLYFHQNANMMPHPTVNPPQQYQRKAQEPKQQKTKVRSEVDPSKPEHSKDEIKKWIESRKRNYPSKANLARKELEKKLKEETGEVVETSLSILEQKLRKKIRILSMIESKADRKREYEKNYLFRCVTNPYKKVKTATFVTSEDNQDKEKDKEKEEKIEDHPLQKNIEENKVQANQDVYDAFKEFQMKINQMEKDEENNEDGSPVERKTISQKDLNNQVEEIENVFDDKRESKPTKTIPKKLKKTPKVLIKPTEGPKKTETIEEIIETLKQRKENDEQEYIKILEGKSGTSDFKYKSNTLLANLLIDSIYHEKNAILQCLRYIVKENFFDPKE